MQEWQSPFSILDSRFLKGTLVGLKCAYQFFIIILVAYYTQIAL